MKNKIEDLRNHMFATLEALQDTENPMDVDRAKAIAQVGSTIIDSAKVEVQYLGVIGGARGSDFIPAEPRRVPALGNASQSAGEQ